MLKYIGLLCGVLMVVSACGAKPETAQDEDPTNALKQSLANYTNACADLAFAQTKAKLTEVDGYKAEGRTSDSRNASNEAVELFKVEEANYQTLNSANEAQYSRVNEVSDRRDAIDADMATLAGGNDQAKAAAAQWQEAIADVNAHIENAKAAYQECFPARAQTELDAADAILDAMQQLIAANTAVVVVETATVEGKVYTVKKGDNLWNIAGAEYSNPFMWPIIYWGNKTQIKDPDLIFPGQNFDIVFDFSQTDQVNAEELAKTRGPWSLYDNK